MTFPLPDDRPERADYVPMWLGRKPDHLPPLTVAWFKAAMQPHSHDARDGTPLCALTPPSRSHVRSYAGIVILVAVLLAAATWTAFAMGIGR